ncbi:MAG: cysteine synthase A [Atopobiaceae bacterium]|nr:cysteine synthase A [Atopobiaceae bacterium]
MICSNVLDALGNTPIIELKSLARDKSARICAKYEGMGVGGSIKTRISAAMIEAAERDGLLHEGSVIVEPTSGNQGIGLSLVGAVKGYDVKIIMPDSVSSERRKLCEAYGAEVMLVHDAGDIGACIEECLATALRLQAEDPERYFVPQQFVNPANPLVHYEQTGAEIVAQVDGTIDGFVSGIGTGGTISGVGKALREAHPDVVIWAVEPDQAAILSGGAIGTHVQMGIGDGLIPENLDQDIYNEVVTVSDEEALSAARALAKYEGLLVGISSGSNICAAQRLAAELGPGKTVVTILPDTGERYLSTELFSSSAVV